MKPTIVDDVFQCPSCGDKTPFEDLDFTTADGSLLLTDDATMTCPVCNSKFNISAILTEPGAVPEPGAAPELPPTPGEEEVPPPEEEVVVEPGAEATVGAEVDQITPKESVSQRVEKALKLLKDGKKGDEVMSSLLTAPMKVHSPKSMKMHEGKVIDLTPSVSQYRHMLQIVAANSTSRADKAWAKDELERIAGVKQWRTSAAPKVDEPLPGKRSFQDPDLAAGRPRNERAVLKKSASAPLREKEEAKKDWEGDFATFNSKLFGCAEDLGIPIDKIEVIISNLQEKDALSLNNDKVKLDLDKAKNSFIDFLAGQEEDAEEQARATDIAEPPPAAPDLGNGGPAAPAPALPVEGKLKEEEEAGNKESVEDLVKRILAKYFA